METEIREFARITEYSFNVKSCQFVIRFLDGSSYILKVRDLPKKLLTKKPRWEDAVLTKDQSALIVQAGKDGKELRLLPFNVIHSRGKQI